MASPSCHSAAGEDGGSDTRDERKLPALTTFAAGVQHPSDDRRHIGGRDEEARLLRKIGAGENISKEWGEPGPDRLDLLVEGRPRLLEVQEARQSGSADLMPGARCLSAVPTSLTASTIEATTPSAAGSVATAAAKAEPKAGSAAMTKRIAPTGGIKDASASSAAEISRAPS